MKIDGSLLKSFWNCVHAKEHFWLKLLLLGGLLLMPCTRSAASPSDVDPSFDAGSTVDDGIQTLAVQSDGRVVISGVFGSVHGVMRSGLARLEANGTTDQTFTADLTGSSGYAPSIVLQADDRVIVAGDFTNINGVACSGLARLETNGVVDPTFTVQLTGTNATGIGVVVAQPDGHLIIVGNFSAVNGTPRAGLARLSANGVLDASFMDGLSGVVGGAIVSIAVQNDGKLVIAGTFATVNGVDRPYLARLNRDGSLDETFFDGMAGPDSLTISAGLQPDGKILIGGFFNSINGADQPGLARLHPNGAVDESFQPEVRSSFWGPPLRFIVDSDARILIGGCLNWPGSLGYFGIVRLNPDGSRDTNFLAEIPAADWSGLRAMRLLDDAKILIAGGYRSSPVPPYLLRLNSDGSTDPSFGNGPAGVNDEVRCLVRQTDGEVILGGRFTALNNAEQAGLARLNRDGSADTNYMVGLTGANGPVFALALTADGKCVVGGEFSVINGVAQPAVARLNGDGTVDTNFLCSLAGPGYAYAMAVQPDGKLLLGGNFSSVNGVSLVDLTRLNSDGSLDLTFQPRLGAGSVHGVHTMAMQGDGKIIIGGYFNSVNGTARKNLARLNANGSLDPSFLNGLAGLNSQPHTVAIQPDGKVLVGGWFESVNGTTRYGFARLNTNGVLDSSFQALSQHNSTAWTIALEDGGKILAGGYLRISNTVHHLVRFNSDGSLDATFGVENLNLNGDVYGLIVQPDTRILLAGGFTIVNQIPRSHVARLLGAFSPPTLLSAPQSQTVEAGSTACFAAYATGVPAVCYQWLFNVTNALASATNSRLQLLDVADSQSGLYTVVVTNSSGAVTSAPAILSVIPAVPRRMVPAIQLPGAVGSQWQVEIAESVESPLLWRPIERENLIGVSTGYFDLTQPLPVHRFYRTRKTSGIPSVPVRLNMQMVPALTLSGNSGDRIRIDGINQFGATDAWFTLDTVTLTNTSQLFFDVTAPGQPARLYRLVPVP